MAQTDRVLRVIFEVVDELNEQFSNTHKLQKDRDTVLFGKSGKLDSLDMINLMVTTEEKLSDEFGMVISITDERAMSQANSPFRTIGTLADYVATLLQEKSDE